MEYIELDFLGYAKKGDPHFKKLFEEITGHKIRKKDQDKNSNSKVYNTKC